MFPLEFRFHSENFRALGIDFGRQQRRRGPGWGLSHTASSVSNACFVTHFLLRTADLTCLSSATSVYPQMFIALCFNGSGTQGIPYSRFCHWVPTPNTNKTIF
jgi:hypothetical protein